MNKKIFSLILICLLPFFILKANDNTYINSNNITYNEAKNIVELSEDSKINFGDTNILIDKAIIDYDKNKIEVFGNFYLYQTINILSGVDLIGDTSLNNFKAKDVNYIYNNDLKIDAKKLERSNENIIFYDNFLTPCELDGFFNCPTWSLRIDKTNYNIERDKFTHFDTFLQIADKKIFYIPYFSHYGAKAPRQKGFLTPTLEFTIGGNQGIKIPYYYPLNINSDFLFTTKLYFDENFNFLKNYNLNTLFERHNSGGITTIDIDNIKKDGSKNINNSLSIETRQVISNKKIFSASGHFTNSVSTSRSTNTEPITFEDLYLKFEQYDFYERNDYLKTELSSIKSFESTNINLIPITPSIKYHNIKNLNKYSLVNNFDFTILKRDESEINKANEGLKLNLENEINSNRHFNGIMIYNKLSISNAYSEYNFINDPSKNLDSIKSLITYSSDYYYNFSKNIKPRFKFIIPIVFLNSDKTINENSQSVTFNYENTFAENRIFGNDLIDNSARLVLGLENNYNFNNQILNFRINQSYDFNKVNNYSKKINQTNNFSDYNLQLSTKFTDLISFSMDARLDQKNFSNKEMSYNLKLNRPLEIGIGYNETQENAYKDLSGDTKSLDLGISKIINNNSSVSYGTKIDLENGYNPFQSNLSLNIFDECSRLEISYNNTRYNDNFNTKPEETISFRFFMDYIGFFGYAQSTNLLFSEPGELNYGN